MTVASQRAQIALYALQMQDGVVARATLRFDNIHDKCVAVESERQKLTAEIQSGWHLYSLDQPPGGPGEQCGGQKGHG